MSPVGLITGCGQLDGIGAATARMLSRRGVSVAVTDLPVSPGCSLQNGDALEQLVSEIKQEGASCIACRGDVRSEQDCARVVAETVAAFGGLDILVNNAAANQGPDKVATRELTAKAWQDQIDVNLTGAFLMARAAIPLLVRSGVGRIVNVSSLAAVVGVPNRAAYSASKAGLLGLTRSLAIELLEQGITVNAVCPGSIATRRARSSKAGPSRHIGESADVATAIAFLVSDEARHITGQMLAIDGGASLTVSG